ncbi:MAG: hypothetical protein FWF28_09765 [Micrococcales bacterium]|nr:hypothetical protein [Micrococcales bacterium]
MLVREIMVSQVGDGVGDAYGGATPSYDADALSRSYDPDFEDTIPNLPRVVIAAAPRPVAIGDFDAADNVIDYDSEFEDTLPNLPKVAPAGAAILGNSATVWPGGDHVAPPQGGKTVTPEPSTDAVAHVSGHEIPWTPRSQTAARRRALALVASLTGIVAMFVGAAAAIADPVNVPAGGSVAGSGGTIAIIIAAVIVVAGVALAVILLLRRRKQDDNGIQPGGVVAPVVGAAEPVDGGAAPESGTAESNDGVTRLGDGEVDPGGGEAVGPGDGSTNTI